MIKGVFGKGLRGCGFGMDGQQRGPPGRQEAQLRRLDGRGPLRQAQGAFGQTDLPGPWGKAQEGQVPGPEVLNGLQRPQASFPLPVFGFIWESPEGVRLAACRFMRCGGICRADRRGGGPMRHACKKRGSGRMFPSPWTCSDPTSTWEPSWPHDETTLCQHSPFLRACPGPGQEPATCCLSFSSQTP